MLRMRCRWQQMSDNSGGWRAEHTQGSPCSPAPGHSGVSPEEKPPQRHGCAQVQVCWNRKTGTWIQPPAPCAGSRAPASRGSRPPCTGGGTGGDSTVEKCCFFRKCFFQISCAICLIFFKAKFRPRKQLPQPFPQTGTRIQFQTVF